MPFVGPTVANLRTDTEKTSYPLQPDQQESFNNTDATAPIPSEQDRIEFVGRPRNRVLSQLRSSTSPVTVLAPAALTCINPPKVTTRQDIATQSGEPLTPAEQRWTELLIHSPNKVWEELQNDRAIIRSLPCGESMRQLGLEPKAGNFLEDIRSYTHTHSPPVNQWEEVLLDFLTRVDLLGRFREISECTGDSRLAALGIPPKPCPLARQRNPVPRTQYQQEAVRIINSRPENPTIVALGSGKLFQTLVVLVQSAATSPHQQMTVHLVDPLYEKLGTTLLQDFTSLLDQAVGCSFKVHVHSSAEQAQPALPQDGTSTVVLGADLADYEFGVAKILKTFNDLLGGGAIGLWLEKNRAGTLIQLYSGDQSWPVPSKGFRRERRPLENSLRIKTRHSASKSCTIL